jgi:hypothetical protein
MIVGKIRKASSGKLAPRRACKYSFIGDLAVGDSVLVSHLSRERGIRRMRTGAHMYARQHGGAVRTEITSKSSILIRRVA